MVFESPDPRPKAGVDSANATRLAHLAPVHADHLGSTRIAPSPAVDSDATRFARDALATDLETEGTRILGHGRPALLNPARYQEVVERYEIGDRIGDRYEVLAIHRGTMGVVYGAFDHVEKLPRALKTLQLRHARDPKMRDMFAAEALTWIRLEKHPFIVRAYLVQQFDGQPYVITEYICGQEGMGGDLRAWLGHPKLTMPIAIEMALQIAQGMQHAVRVIPGLLHRDLKPANVLVDSLARAMVTDFGLVHAEEAGAGTPAYMAPEQWRAESLDSRTDIYAYGCILYEMFTGHRMYDAYGEREWEAAHLTQMPVSPMTLNPILSPQISAFIVRCLSKQREHRPPDWNEVVLECAHWFHKITGLPVVFDFSADVLSARELVNAGRSFNSLGKTDEALVAFERALGLDAGDVGAWFSKGHTLTGLKRYPEALAAYDRLLAVDSNNARAWFGRGFALHSLNRDEDAVSAYDQAMALDAATAYPWNAKGLVQQLSTLSEGVTVKGVVKNVTEYGAFVDLGGIDGLLHVTDLAWCRPKHPTEVINVGDQVTAKVLKVDTQKNRISLGLKQLAEDPWIGSSRRYPEGSRQLGKVISITDYGPFVQFESGIEGLVHVSEMDVTNTNVHPSKIVQMGDEVEVIILAIDETHRRMSLSMKQGKPNLSDDFANLCLQGDALSDSKQYQEAVSAYDRALSLRPEDAAIWFKKGHVLLRLERYDDALAAYDRASSLDATGTRGGVSYIKAFTLLKLKRYPEAISACDRALALNQNFEAAVRTRTMALRELKIQQETLQEIKRFKDSVAASQAQQAQQVLPRPRSFWSRLLGK